MNLSDLSGKWWCEGREHKTTETCFFVCAHIYACMCGGQRASLFLTDPGMQLPASPVLVSNVNHHILVYVSSKD